VVGLTVSVIAAVVLVVLLIVRGRLTATRRTASRV
jgi:hypothetical protein